MSENKTNNTNPTLFLFPSLLSNVAPSSSLPLLNIELISKVKHFIVEDIRSARRFLKACNPAIVIDQLSFSVLNVNTLDEDIPSLVSPLEQGYDVGIISEAGCPAIADPGAVVVEEAHRRGFEVVPLVGPSSIILALMASGFNGQKFCFNGYLPIEQSKRVPVIKSLYHKAVTDNTTQIFIETPYRNNKMIEAIISALPSSAKLCVAQDLTGPAQRIVSQPIEKWKRVKLDFDKIPAIFLIYR